MKSATLHKILFVSTLLFYLFTRIVKIEDFPIYFFCDEAIVGTKAEELLENNFKDRQNNFLPMTIKSTGYHMLGLNVHLNIPGVLFFGKKIWSIRFTTVLVALLGCVYTALIAKNIFRIKFYWLAVFFLGFSPIYFFLSRTGFPNAIFTAFYAGFIYYYLQYRIKNSSYLYLSIFFAALAIYTFNIIWLPIVSMIIGLIIVDLPYHFRNAKTALFGCIFAVIIFLPLIKFNVDNIQLNTEYLRSRDSLITKEIPPQEKFDYIVRNYLNFFVPKFLFYYYPTYVPFFPFKDYGFYPLWAFPLYLIGLFILLLKLNRPYSRIILISLLTSPLPSAVMTEPQATRIIPSAVPLTCVFLLGVKAIYDFRYKIIRWKSFNKLFYLIIFISVFIYSYKITKQSVTEGPLWYQDYKMMQYGAKQLFPEVNKSLDEYQHVDISSFTFDTITVASFFLTKEKVSRVTFRDTRDYLRQKLTTDNTVIFSIPDEFEDLVKSQYFSKIEIKKIIPAPNGSPAFYKIELKYR
ncbi:glycosyltransferase family 39 protein [Candidatus Gottesmanbacteria bacterium]|nr:glycosyltransferase family 39 protein [Candidatus Gottesmanbacteria bacterium]